MRYTMVSGLFFALLTCVQVLRVVMGWPVRVASVDVPIWASVVAAGGWIYNDLPKAFLEAAKTRKPMLVVFRCVP